MTIAKTNPNTTSVEIRRIIGSGDAELVNDILRTGATTKDVAEAFQWRQSDDYMGAQMHKKAGSAVRAVYGLLDERVQPDKEGAGK
jgi:hypothetical protein